MSANEIIVFLPECVAMESVLKELTSELSLKVDVLPENFPFDFSAQRRDEKGYILIEYKALIGAMREELLAWDKPTPEYKQILANTKASLTIHYRPIEIAKDCMQLMGKTIGDNLSRCVVENGRGCLLKLSDIVKCLALERSWTWEKEQFPELEGVASSEWLDE